LFIGDVNKAGVLSNVLDTRPANGHKVKDKASAPSDVDKAQGDEAGARSYEANAIVLTEIEHNHVVKDIWSEFICCLLRIQIIDDVVKFLLEVLVVL
jgi:hypothetical protein